jgi:hypothetical protein
MVIETARALAPAGAADKWPGRGAHAYLPDLSRHPDVQDGEDPVIQAGLVLVAFALIVV